MQSLNFQSYLVLGKPQNRRGETIKLLKETGINIAKVSPDLFFIAPEKSKISIEQIRDLKSHIFQKPVSLPYKVVIIEEAEKLTPEAQNALLKILEEPPNSAVIILEARDKFQILETIISRVVTIHAKQGLTLHQGLTLLDTENDTLSLLEEISKIDNPQTWLDDQMLALYNSLQKSAKEKRGVGEIENAIRQCAAAKQMIEANVNPRHVLTNLILSIHA